MDYFTGQRTIYRICISLWCSLRGKVFSMRFRSVDNRSTCFMKCLNAFLHKHNLSRMFLLSLYRSPKGRNNPFEYVCWRLILSCCTKCFLLFIYGLKLFQNETKGTPLIRESLCTLTQNVSEVPINSHFYLFVNHLTVILFLKTNEVFHSFIVQNIYRK